MLHVTYIHHYYYQERKKKKKGYTKYWLDVVGTYAWESIHTSTGGYYGE